jgi:hypothetical protein
MTLDDLDRASAPLRAYISSPIEFPEPAQKLDMASRQGAPDRQFKYLHQMCLLHASNFTRANQIKVVSLLDGYKAVIAAGNPIGPYLFTRSILELSAFICDVSTRLREIASKPDASWMSKGEEFFSCIVRARFATTDPKKRQALEAAGMPARLLKPINVMNSIATLLAQPGAADVLRDQYDKLCDFVHHNLSSQVTSSPGFRTGDVAHSAGGGALVMMKGGPITRYEYPVPHKPKLAVEETLPVVMKCVEVCVEHLNRIPETPFSAAQLQERTGSSIGLTALTQGSLTPTQH